MYYPCSENKGADQLIYAFVFAYADCWFSYVAAQIVCSEFVAFFSEEKAFTHFKHFSYIRLDMSIHENILVNVENMGVILLTSTFSPGSVHVHLACHKTASFLDLINYIFIYGK